MMNSKTIKFLAFQVHQQVQGDERFVDRKLSKMDIKIIEILDHYYDCQSLNYEELGNTVLGFLMLIKI